MNEQSARFPKLPMAWVIGILSFSHSFAQEKPIVLENADSLVGSVRDGQRVRELIGNVRFSQGSAHVTTDRALQYIETGKIILTGHVVVNDDSVIMTSPRGIYYREEHLAEVFDGVILEDGKVHLTAEYGKYLTGERRAFFRNDVVLKDSSSTLVCDSLVYFRTEQHTIAMGDVAIHNPDDNVTIQGSHFENFGPEQFSRMTENPVLVQFDTSASGRIDTLVVRSMVMESYRDSSKRLIAQDSVRIVRSDLAAVGGLAIFYTAGDSILLRQSPVVWYSRTQVSGDSITVFLEDRKLHRVRVVGNAFAASQNDSLHADRFDQITGEELQMHFANQALERIDVNVHAISLYHVYEDTAANGLNKTSGDHVTMLWSEGKLSSIRVYSGVEGQYFPETLIAGRESEYAVAGFSWREDRPFVRPTDFIGVQSILNIQNRVP